MLSFKENGSQHFCNICGDSKVRAIILSTTDFYFITVKLLSNSHTRSSRNKQCKIVQKVISSTQNITKNICFPNLLLLSPLHLIISFILKEKNSLSQFYEF